MDMRERLAVYGILSFPNRKLECERQLRQMYVRGTVCV